MEIYSVHTELTTRRFQFVPSSCNKNSFFNSRCVGNVWIWSFFGLNKRKYGSEWIIFHKWVVFLLSIIDKIPLPRWPHNILNSKAELPEISNKDIGNMVIQLLHIRWVNNWYGGLILPFIYQHTKEFLTALYSLIVANDNNIHLVILRTLTPTFWNKYKILNQSLKWTYQIMHRLKEKLSHCSFHGSFYIKCLVVMTVWLFLQFPWVYSEFCQTIKVNQFSEIVNG